MTDALVRRCDAPTPPRITSAAQLAIVGTPPVLVEIRPTVRNRLGCFVGRRLHTPEPAKHRAHVAQIEARHRRFGPFQALQRGAILGFGDGVDILCTVVIIGYPFNAGHFVASITYRKSLLVLPRQG